MESELPSISYQKKKLFRPNDTDIVYAYNLINRQVFRNQLYRPIIRTGRVNSSWGVCQWFDRERKFGTFCEIWLADKWFCQQWFMNVLAHEMIHQWQWDVYRFDHMTQFGRDINYHSSGHGPSFFVWRDEFKHYGLNLKGWFRTKKWFIYQNFDKC
jgi:hypothetical protein